MEFGNLMPRELSLRAPPRNLLSLCKQLNQGMRYAKRASLCYLRC